jgi:hypothetical protein
MRFIVSVKSLPTSFKQLLTPSNAFLYILILYYQEDEKTYADSLVRSYASRTPPPPPKQKCRH